MTSEKKIFSSRQKKDIQVKSARKKIAASQVTDLKRKVMDEMTKQNESNKTPPASQQKESVAPLPHTYNHKNTTSYGQDRWLTGVLILTVILIIGLLMWGQQEHKSPSMALYQIEKAFKEGDIKTFQRHVNTEKLAENIVEQFYQNMVFNIKDLPQELRQKLPQQQNIEGMAKNGLTERLKEDAFAVITKSTQPESLPHDLLATIWQKLSSGQKMSYHGVRNIIADNSIAEMSILLKREHEQDSLIELPLRFENSTQGWQLVDIPNFNSTLNQASNIQIQAKAEAPTPNKVSVQQETLDLENILQIESIRKLSTDTSEGSTSNILVTLKLRNIGPQDVKSFGAEIVFNDAAGQFIKSFYLSDTIGVTRGMRLEKTWKLPINKDIRMEKHIYNLPQEAIQVRAIPRIVELVDGEIVKG